MGIGSLALIVFVLSVGYLYTEYDFEFDVTSQGNFLIWYTNQENERVYHKIF